MNTTHPRQTVCPKCHADYHRQDFCKRCDGDGLVTITPVMDAAALLRSYDYVVDGRHATRDGEGLPDHHALIMDDGSVTFCDGVVLTPDRIRRRLGLAVAS